MQLTCQKIAPALWRPIAYREPMTQRLETRLNPHAPIVLSLFRIFFGLLFLCHGTSLMFGWPAGPVAASGSLFWLSGLIELITGILITLGLFARPAVSSPLARWLSRTSPNTFRTGCGRSATAVNSRSCTAGRSFCWCSPGRVPRHSTLGLGHAARGT